MNTSSLPNDVVRSDITELLGAFKIIICQCLSVGQIGFVVLKLYEVKKITKKQLAEVYVLQTI